MKKIVIDAIAEQIDLDICEIENLIEIPPALDMGDFAFPCFSLAKTMKKSPAVIAEDLVGKFGKIKGVEKIEAKGPYINFFMDRIVLADQVLKKDYSFGSSKFKGKILIDMSSPNIAKPFGIGHLRSTIIGNSLGKICEANGYEVVKINYLGDWGTQFGKIILGWKKGGSEEKLKKSPIEHLYELYIEANDDKFVEDAKVEFKKLEEGDKENLELWKKFRELSLEEFNEIYDLLGVSFDEISGESLYNNKMDAIVDELKEKGIVEEDDGALIVDMKDENSGVALIQKSDGTSLYVTRDLAAVKERREKYNFDRIIYEVGAEQKLYFVQLFKILERLGYSWAKDCVHAAHGLYLDNDGKKFATRKGKTVFMKDILDEVIEKARGNLLVREELSENELNRRARVIALAAIFYGDLKNNREHNMVFDVDRFLSFEGDTGPYLLYSYARASSLLRKAKAKVSRDFELKEVGDSEVKLLKRIDGFEEAVRKAYEGLAPNVIANYCFYLAQDFNEFYHACPVLGGEDEGFRLRLVEVFRDVLGRGLDLLGIEKLEEM